MRRMRWWTLLLFSLVLAALLGSAGAEKLQPFHEGNVELPPGYTRSVQADRGILKPPKKLNATVKGTKVTLKWPKVKKATHYIVWEWTAGEFYILNDRVTTTSYTVKNARKGDHWYAVAAYRKNQSGELQVIQTYAKVSTQGTVKKPKLTLSYTGDRKVSISWQECMGTSYILYRSTRKDGGFKKITTTKKLFYEDTVPKRGTTYYYKLVAKAKVKGKTQKTTSAVKSVYISLANQDHWAFTTMDIGECKRLQGSVELMLVFVSTPKYPWTEAAQEQVINATWESVHHLEEEAARYGTALELSFAYYAASTRYEIPVADPSWNPETTATTGDRWYEDLMSSYFHVDNLVTLQRQLASSRGRSSCPFVFLFNKRDRSYALPAWVEYPGFAEYCVCFCANEDVTFTLSHELLHLYGAVDLYDEHNPAIPAATQQWLGNTVMEGTGDQVDELTAYLIGWRASVTAAVNGFLNATIGLRHLIPRRVH